MPDPVTTSKHTILQDVEITGSIIFKGELTFDGKLTKGNLQGDALVVGKNADIRGDIKVASLRVLGTVTGEVAVDGKCEIGDTAVFNGSLQTMKLAMAEGAHMNGQVNIGPARNAPAKRVG